MGKGCPLGCRVCCNLSLSQMCPGQHQNQGLGWRRITGLSPPVILFTDRSKAVLLLSIICVFLCLAFVMLSRPFIAALWSPAGKGLISWLLFVMLNCTFVTFPCGILGQLCHLIISIPDLCPLSYLY